MDNLSEKVEDFLVSFQVEVKFRCQDELAFIESMQKDLLDDSKESLVKFYTNYYENLRIDKRFQEQKKDFEQVDLEDILADFLDHPIISKKFHSDFNALFNQIIRENGYFKNRLEYEVKKLLLKTLKIKIKKFILN